MSLVFGATCVTSYAAFVVHKTIIGSCQQPSTMCAEYKAAEVQRQVSSSTTVLSHLARVEADP